MSDLLRLHNAAHQGDVETLKALLAEGADLDRRDAEEGGTALHWACGAKQRDTVVFLIDQGADAEAADRYGRTPLMEMAVHDDLGMISLLVEHGAKIDAGNASKPPALSNAAVWGKYGAAELLVRLGADVNAPDSLGNAPLFWVAGGGLRAAGSNPLFYSPAVTRQRLKIAQLLVDRGAKLDLRNHHGTTALDAALREADDQQFFEIASFLRTLPGPSGGG